MSEIPLFGLFTKEGRERKQFARLRQEVHLQKILQYDTRIRSNPKPNPEEASLGLLIEELEPQVRDAVLSFNKKGYKTISSGFNGTDAEHQIIAGNFLFDEETKGKLQAMGVGIKVEPWWKWQLDERRGEANPTASEEEKMLTTVQFRPEHPDLQEMETMWRQIAAVLPDRKQPAS